MKCHCRNPLSSFVAITRRLNTTWKTQLPANAVRVGISITINIDVSILPLKESGCASQKMGEAKGDQPLLPAQVCRGSDGIPAQALPSTVSHTQQPTCVLSNPCHTPTELCSLSLTALVLATLCPR